MGGSSKNLVGGAGLGLLAGLALAPVTGGASLAMGAMMGASGGALAGGAKELLIDKPKDALKKSLEGIGLKKENKNTMPYIDNEAMAKTKAASILNLQKRSGRASTLLTTQNAQNNTFG